VAFFDSTGLNVLNAASADAAARGVRLVLRPSRHPPSVLEGNELRGHLDP